MPNISLVPVPLYNPLDPYIHTVDNRPLLGILDRIDLVNNQVDIDTSNLAAAAGNQGSVSNRLNQSINEDGTLKTIAIDNALHSIAEHIDTGGFVRMTDAERAKLSFIADNATSLQVEVNTISGIRTFINETMMLQPSDSILWRTSGQNVYADTNFPAAVRHLHYYGLVPVHVNIITPDYQNYYVTSVATPYREGSLRVYVNGVRLNQYVPVFVPIGVPGPLSWLSLSFSEDTATSGIVTSGKFTLSSPIPVSANIIVDFDVLFS